MEIRPIIGDVLAARITAPGTERPILEIKTNGKCQPMTPDIRLAHNILCDNFEVPLSKRRVVFESIQNKQFDPDFLHLLLTKQLSYKD